RKGEEAGKGEVEIRQDADRRRLDDVPAEAVEIARPGAPRIDEGGGATAPRYFGGVDAERGAAPIDMGVEVDEAGRHDEPGDVAHLGAGRHREVGADRAA